MTNPCQICGQPAEADDNSRYPWCEACFEDCTAVGHAVMMAKTKEQAIGYWTNFKEWTTTVERKEGTLGLWNCDGCGFLMRLPYPIGGESLCGHCSEHSSDEEMAFFRVTGDLYRAMNVHRETLGISWQEFFRRIEKTVARALVRDMPQKVE